MYSLSRLAMIIWTAPCTLWLMILVFDVATHHTTSRLEQAGLGLGSLWALTTILIIWAIPMFIFCMVALATRTKS